MLNPFKKHCETLLVLVSHSLLDEAFELDHVLHELEVLASLLDVLRLDLSLLSSLDGRLESTHVRPRHRVLILVLLDQLNQVSFLGLARLDLVTVAVTLLKDELLEIILVGATTIVHVLERKVSLVRALLLGSLAIIRDLAESLLFSVNLLLEYLVNSFLLIITSLARVLADLRHDDLARASEVLQELLDLVVHVIEGLREQDSSDHLFFFSHGGALRRSLSALSRRLTTFATLGSGRHFFLVLLADAVSLLAERRLLLLSELLTKLLLLLRNELKARRLGLLSSARLFSLPATLELALAILLVRVLDQRQRFAAVHLDAPADILTLLIDSFALGPFIQIEQRLNHVVVLDLVALCSSLVSQALVAAEHEVRQSDLIVASLRVDGLAIVEHVDAEVLGLVLLQLTLLDFLAFGRIDLSKLRKLLVTLE